MKKKKDNKKVLKTKDYVKKVNGFVEISEDFTNDKRKEFKIRKPNSKLDSDENARLIERFLILKTYNQELEGTRIKLLELLEGIEKCKIGNYLVKGKEITVTHPPREPFITNYWKMSFNLTET